ncbi:MAG: hypothetical protein RR346_02840 [Bacteroidales bacterium]
MNHIFKIKHLKSEVNDHAVEVELNTNHRIFEGHFPEQPVVPGACMIEVIKRCVSTILGSPYRYASIGEFKFMSLILPDKDMYLLLKLTISLEKEGGAYSVKGTVLSKDVMKLKFKTKMEQI